MFKSAKTIVALAATAAAFAGVAGTASAANFGADLDPSVQPSNSSSPHPCNGFEGQKCTWVLNDAYGAPGHEKAPQDGTLKQIKLIAGAPGSFRLQLVKVRADQSAKVIANGPKIHYEGQEDPNANDYTVETFKTNVPVKQGEQLAISTKKTSTLRCSSGGDNTLLYNPVLEVGNAFQNLGSDDGCWLLIEGTVK